ncbi:Signal transduction histidine kinase [Flavobacterium swingsii]|uniref:histidine kinase n=2 Tax=Flavobacterium swingsii TaxID=498292 RepID=A0A1I0V617_9FLAO|nr:Signal transduction histidine kinase [Flavobacterium swingsii]
MIVKFNNKRRLVTTYSKVVFVLFIVTIGFSILFFSLYYYTLRQEKQIYNNFVAQYRNEMKSLNDLNAESYISVISDITYWDEFVNFTKTRDLSWFNRSVANILDTHKIDYLSVYNDKGVFITSVSDTKIKSKDIIPKEVLTKLYEKKIDKFYMKIPEGIAEVYGATVQPSDDPFKNKYPPAGYFFMIRLLDDNYFVNLEKISSSNINFHDDKDKIEDKLVYSLIELKDYNGKTVAKLLFNRIYKVDFRITKNILLIFVFAFLISLFIFHYYAVKWAKKPIKLIKKVLENGDEGAINSLKNIKGEFRYIGKLFEENQNQKRQLQKSKQKAEESDKLKTAFLTNLSHEIRTPMNAILGFSDLLDSEDISKAEEIEYRKIINKSGKNLVSIIDDLVEMSKIDANQIETRYTDFDLDECVQNVVNEIKKTIPKNQQLEIKIEKSKNGLSKKIITDKPKLVQILTNLLSNAVKFTDKGSIVLFYDIDSQSSMISFYVIDSGIGIEKDSYEKIFKRFIKIENDHSIRGGGLGLGLTLTKAYIESLGGQISLESEFGVSSTFKFSIPLILDKNDAPQNENVFDEYLPKNESVTTILVAEDDNFNFLLIEKILKTKNYKIIRAEDGEKAVEIISNNNDIDLILMDIKMPKLSGHQAFEIIKKMRPKLPVIAQTAFTSSDEVEKIFKSGFSGYISKPIKKDLLYQMIEKLSFPL